MVKRGRLKKSLYSLGLIPFLLLMYLWFSPSEHFLDRLKFWFLGGRQIYFTPERGGYLLDQCSLTNSSQSSSPCACVALIPEFGVGAFDNWKEILLWSQAEWKKMGLQLPLRLLAMNLPPWKPSEIYSVRQISGEMTEDLRSRCSRWMILGNGFGGWIASWIALNWREGVQSLILLNSAGLKSFRSERDYLQAYPTQDPDEDLDGRISTLHVPTLVFWGNLDPFLSHEKGKILHSLIPGGIWREAEGCGHFPQKDCTYPLVHTIIEMFDYGRM